MGQAARFRRPRGAARRSRQLPPPEARFRPTVCGGGLRFRSGEFRAHPALGGAGLLASCSMGCPAQGRPGRGRSRPVGGAGAEKALQAPHHRSDPARPVRVDGPEAPANFRPWRPLPALRGPRGQDALPPAPLPPGPEPPFHSRLTPDSQNVPSPVEPPTPGPRIASRPRAPRAACARPAPGAEPAGRPATERSGCGGCEPVSPFSPVRPRPSSSLRSSGSSRRPTRPARFSSRAGGAARSGRGIGECHPSPGLKPFRDP